MDLLTYEAFTDCKAIRNSLTPVIAFKSSEMQISGLKKHNEESLEGVVILLITEITGSMITSEKMNSFQIIRIAQSLLKDFWYFKLEEFVFVLDSITKRKNYNRLDQTVIYDAFNEYELKRQSVIEAVKIQEFKASEEVKEQEIQALREFYVKAKEGNREPLYIEKIAEIKKKGDIKEDAYKKARAEYLAKKEIERIRLESEQDNQDLNDK